MLENGAAGAVGILVEAAIFVVIALHAARSRGLTQGLLYGGVIAVYGYALAISFTSLLGIPWQATNVALAVGVSLFSARPSTRKVIAEQLPIAMSGLRRAWAAIAIVGAVLAFAVLMAALQADLSIDGQLYHGPVLASIVQSGSLWGWNAPNEYLFYSDLTMAGGVNLATFAGDARFDNAIQVPHLFLLVVAIVWVLGRKYRSSFARASIATLIVAAPVIWMQPRILYVDLAYGAAVAIAILMIVAVSEFRLLDAVVTGVAIAAVIATKPAGVLTGLILLAAFAIALYVRGGGTEAWRSSVATFAVGAGPALVFASAFYVRNWFAFDNPVYPVKAALGPLVFPGIIDLSVFASGERGNGLVDPGRLVSYGDSLLQGMIWGVDKPDYDPRAGGFGYVPLVVLALAIAVAVLSLVRRLRGVGERDGREVAWRAPVAMMGIVMAILLVQPSTFDTRYVIGPTAVILTAVLLLAAFPVPSRAQTAAGVLALVAAASQIMWSEQNVYAGVQTSLDVMRGPAQWQPNSPAGLGSRDGLAVAWLPDECVTIALETAGGVTPSGMSEGSYLGALPYGLYGDSLCNEVVPITRDDGADYLSSIAAADFMVLYADDVDLWAKEYPTIDGCFTEVYEVKGNESYPLDLAVLADTCG